MAMTDEEISQVTDSKFALQDALDGLAEATNGRDVRKYIYGIGYKTSSSASSAAASAKEASDTLTSTISTLPANSSRGTAITSGADLNLITTSGNYYIPDRATGQTLLNAPSRYKNSEANLGRLIVAYATSKYTIYQFLITWDANLSKNAFWARTGRYSDSSAVYTWSDWENAGDSVKSEGSFPETAEDGTVIDLNDLTKQGIYTKYGDSEHGWKDFPPNFVDGSSATVAVFSGVNDGSEQVAQIVWGPKKWAFRIKTNNATGWYDWTCYSNGDEDYDKIYVKRRGLLPMDPDLTETIDGVEYKYADLDTLFEPGIYSKISDESCGWKNFPPNMTNLTMATVMVMRGYQGLATNKHILQIVYSSYETAWRYHGDSVWHEWSCSRRGTLPFNAKASDKSTENDVTDMNLVTAPGTYTKYGGSDDYIWTNYPDNMTTKTWATVLVVSGIGTGNVDHTMQIVIAPNSKWAYRYTTNGTTGWAAWCCYPKYQPLICDAYLKLTDAIYKCKRQWTALRPITSSDTGGTRDPDKHGYVAQGSNLDYISYSGLFQCGEDVFFHRGLPAYFSARENPASLVYSHLEQYGTDDEGNPLYKPVGNYEAYNLPMEQYTGRYQGAGMGAICTSFVGWLMSQTIYRGCDDLADPSYDIIEFYDYKSMDDTEAGDILLYDGSGAHIKVVVGKTVNPVTHKVQEIITAEQGTTKVLYNSEEDINELITNGYVFGRYKDAVLREIPAVRYAHDIISQHGNNTFLYKSAIPYSATTPWMYKNETPWMYMPNESFIANVVLEYIDDEYAAAIPVDELPTSTINEATVYDFSKYMSIPGHVYSLRAATTISASWVEDVDSGTTYLCPDIGTSMPPDTVLAVLTKKNGVESYSLQRWFKMGDVVDSDEKAWKSFNTSISNYIADKTKVSCLWLASGYDIAKFRVVDVGTLTLSTSSESTTVTATWEHSNDPDLKAVYRQIHYARPLTNDEKKNYPSSMYPHPYDANTYRASVDTSTKTLMDPDETTFTFKKPKYDWFCARLWIDTGYGIAYVDSDFIDQSGKVYE